MPASGNSATRKTAVKAKACGDFFIYIQKSAHFRALRELFRAFELCPRDAVLFCRAVRT